MREKDALADGNLRKVIRLLKYLRDHRNSFTGTRSIILTTLMGNQVDASKKLGNTGYYGNVPTALLHIVQDLDKHLQANEIIPSIKDPSGSGVTFDHRWDQSTYSYFRDRIRTHASEIDAAYHTLDKEKSVAMWQALFGTGFKAPESQSSTSKFPTSTTAAIATAGRSGRAG